MPSTITEGLWHGVRRRRPMADLFCPIHWGAEYNGARRPCTTFCVQTRLEFDAANSELERYFNSIYGAHWRLRRPKA